MADDQEFEQVSLARRVTRLEVGMEREAAYGATTRLMISLADQELAETRVHLRQQTALMSALRQTQREQGTRLDRVESRLNRVESRLDRVESRLDAVESRLDAVESRLDAVESRLDAVESRLGGVESRLESMETRLTGVESQLSVLTGLVHEVIGLLRPAPPAASPDAG